MLAVSGRQHPQRPGRRTGTLAILLQAVAGTLPKRHLLPRAGWPSFAPPRRGQASLAAQVSVGGRSLRLKALLLAAAAVLSPGLALAQTPPAPVAKPAQAKPAEGATAVEGVTVTSDSTAMRTSIDRRSYSVANDLSAKTGSIADALRNILLGRGRRAGQCQPARRRQRHDHDRRQAVQHVQRRRQGRRPAADAGRPDRPRGGDDQPLGRLSSRRHGRDHQS